MCVVDGDGERATSEGADEGEALAPPAAAAPTLLAEPLLENRGHAAALLQAKRREPSSAMLPSW